MGRIEPSILILIGEFEVKNRSDALRSTMSLNSGLVLRTIDGAASVESFTSMVSTNFSFTTGISPPFLESAGSERAALLFFVDDGERAAVVEVLHLALALELDPETQLVFRVGVAQRV